MIGTGRHLLGQARFSGTVFESIEGRESEGIKCVHVNFVFLRLKKKKYITLKLRETNQHLGGIGCVLSASAEKSIQVPNAACVGRMSAKLEKELSEIDSGIAERHMPNFDPHVYGLYPPRPHHRLEAARWMRINPRTFDLYGSDYLKEERPSLQKMKSISSQL
jgi:hypothetical protein